MESKLFRPSCKLSRIQLAFTYKKLGSEEPDERYYDDIIYKIQEIEGVEVHDYVFEKDSLGRLHIHGYLECYKRLFRKRLVIQGCHCYIKEIDDFGGWLDYINKQRSKAIEGAPDPFQEYLF